MSNDFYNRLRRNTKYLETQIAFFSLPQGISNSGIHMKKTLLAVSAALALTSSFTANAAENDQPQYLSDWWHQSVNVVGSYHTRFSPKLNNDVYLEYEAFAKKDWFDFYGYIDIPKTFDWGNGNDKGIWSDGSPLFMEIEPRFSIDKLTGADLSFGPFKEWYSPTTTSTIWAITSQPPEHMVYGSGDRYRHRPADGSVAERVCEISVAKLRRVQ